MSAAKRNCPRVNKDSISVVVRAGPAPFPCQSRLRASPKRDWHVDTYLGSTRMPLPHGTDPGMHTQSRLRASPRRDWHGEAEYHLSPACAPETPVPLPRRKPI